MQREFEMQGIPFQAQPPLHIRYKGVPLNKTYQPDFICYDVVIVEMKAISELSGTEEVQLINYLKATALKEGLPINFGTQSLQYKRFIL